jgi:hypothetical protein
VRLRSVAREDEPRKTEVKVEAEVVVADSECFSHLYYVYSMFSLHFLDPGLYPYQGRFIVEFRDSDSATVQLVDINIPDSQVDILHEVISIISKAVLTIAPLS